MIRGDGRTPRWDSGCRQAGTAAGSPGRPGGTWGQWAGSTRSHLRTRRGTGCRALCGPGGLYSGGTFHILGRVLQNPQSPFREGLGASPSLLHLMSARAGVTRPPAASPALGFRAGHCPPRRQGAMPARAPAQVGRRRRGPRGAPHAPHPGCPAAGFPGLRLGVALLRGPPTQVERAHRGKLCVVGRFPVLRRSSVRLPLLLFLFFLEP